MAADLPKQIGRYVVLGQLGHGARSRILQVRDPSSGQMYTLKHVVRHSEDDDRFVEQAEIEYEVSRQFDHPYLRKSFELKKMRTWKLGKVTQLYLLMEYFEGATLKQRCPTDLMQIITVFVKVAQGLEALHKMGYCHTDIKPKNVLINANGGLKIIDFGQCCLIGERKERIQGTPDFMAPEQVQRKIIDQRTDVFNLGASLYWVLTGQNYPTAMPKPATTELALTHVKDPPSPQEINSEVPTALSKLVMDCCQDHPVARPEGMREVIARLEVARHILERARSPEPLDRGQPPADLAESGEFAALEESTDSEDGDIERWLGL